MKKKYADGGMFRAGMPVPQDVDGASVTPGPKKPAMKKSAPVKRPVRSEPDGGGGAALPGSLEGKGVTPAFKKGGSVSARADGIAKRGRTNCKMV